MDKQITKTSLHNQELHFNVIDLPATGHERVEFVSVNIKLQITILMTSHESYRLLCMSGLTIWSNWSR